MRDHDAKIEKPKVAKGFKFSDPVLVKLTDGRIYVARWCSKDGYWHDTEQETFGDVAKWAELPVLKNWGYDESQFGEEEE